MEKKWDFALLDLADVLGVALDREGRIVDWNGSCERATGYSFDDVRGQRFSDLLVVSEDREGVERAFGEVISGRFPLRHESAWRTKSGERRWVVWNNTAMVGPDGRVEHVIGAGVDMTERLQLLAKAEQEREAARRSALLVTSIVENIPDMIFVKDAKTLGFVLLNRAAEELLGWERHEMLGKTGTEFFPEEEMRFFAEKDRAVLASGALVDIPEEPIHTRLKGERALHTKKIPIKGDDGTPLYLLGISRDITERKRAEDAQRFLSEASEALASSIDFSATLAQVAQLAVPRLADWCIILLAGDDGSLQPVKVACADPSKVDIVRQIERRIPAPSTASSARAVRSGQPALTRDITDEHLVASAIDPDQLEAMRRMGIRSRIAVPLRAQGRPLGAMILLTAESQRHYDEQDMALAQEVAHRAALAVANARLYQAAQRAIHTRQELLAVVSHDLKNPLGSIGLHAHLIARVAPPGDAGERVRDAAAHIWRSVQRMDHLIRDLLDAAAIEAGRFSVSRTGCEAQLLVDEALELMQPMVYERGQRLEWKQPAGGLPPLECDRDRVLQVFSNLIGNAIKFTPPEGSITVSAERDGEMVRFEVTDTGPGIPAEALPHLFDRYWQASRAGRAGAGLGLYIVQGIVEAHGGKVWVESRPAPGSTFRFTLPVSKP